MNQLMFNLCNLEHFEIVTEGLLNMTDAHDWEKITRSLTTFNFKIMVTIFWTEDIMNSFRTPYWLHEKKWFVACTWKSLFSVPYFADTCVDRFFRPPLYSTVADKTIFSDRVNHFIYNDASQHPECYLRHVKTLELRSSESLDLLPTFLDMNSTEHLILASSIERSNVLFLLKHLPHLKKLSINEQILRFVEETKQMCLECVETLEINDPKVNSSFYILELLARLFPRVETLHISSTTWPLLVGRLIDRLEDLSKASFRFEVKPRPNEQIQYQNIENNIIWQAVRASRRMKKFNYSYRCTWDLNVNQSHFLCLNFWIKKQVSI